jgi:hypothetical protein
VSNHLGARRNRQRVQWGQVDGSIVVQGLGPTGQVLWTRTYPQGWHIPGHPELGVIADEDMPEELKP